MKEPLVSGKPESVEIQVMDQKKEALLPKHSEINEEAEEDVEEEEKIGRETLPLDSDVRQYLIEQYFMTNKDIRIFENAFNDAKRKTKTDNRKGLNIKGLEMAFEPPSKYWLNHFIRITDPSKNGVVHLEDFVYLASLVVPSITHSHLVDKAEFVINVILGKDPKEATSVSWKKIKSFVEESSKHLELNVPLLETLEDSFLDEITKFFLDRNAKEDNKAEENHLTIASPNPIVINRATSSPIRYSESFIVRQSVVNRGMAEYKRTFQKEIPLSLFRDFLIDKRGHKLEKLRIVTPWSQRLSTFTLFKNTHRRTPISYASSSRAIIEQAVFAMLTERHECENYVNRVCETVIQKHYIEDGDTLLKISSSDWIAMGLSLGLWEKIHNIYGYDTNGNKKKEKKATLNQAKRWLKRKARPSNFCKSGEAVHVQPTDMISLQSKRSFEIQKWIERNFWWCFLLFLIVFTIALVVSPMMTPPRLVEFLGPAVYIPRAAAGGTVITIFLIPFSMSYGLLEKLQELTVFRVYFRLHKQKDFHILIGWTAAVFGFIHFIAWLVLYRKFADQINEDQNQDVCKDIINTLELFVSCNKQITVAQVYFGTRVSITGWICIIMLALLAVPAWHRVKHFNLFYICHKIGYIVFFASIMFHFNAWRYFMVPVFYFGCERLYCYCKARRKYRVQKVTHDKSTKETFLQLVKPKRNRNVKKGGVYPSAGDFAWIQVQKVSSYEWHPFSVTRQDANTIEFRMQRAGDWCKKLEVGLTEINQPVHIYGPFSFAFPLLHDFNHLVLIGGGIGVTPMASILRYMQSVLTSEENQEKEHFYDHRVDFIWSLRQQEKVEWFLEFLTKLRDVWDQFNIRIYLTSRNSDGLDSGGLQLLDDTEIGKVTVGNGLEVYLGRADWSFILDEMVDYHLNIFGVSGDDKDNQIGVIFCGQNDVGKSIEKVCIKKSSPQCNFHFYGETF